MCVYLVQTGAADSFDGSIITLNRSRFDPFRRVKQRLDRRRRPPEIQWKEEGLKETERAPSL